MKCRSPESQCRAISRMPHVRQPSYSCLLSIPADAWCSLFALCFPRVSVVTFLVLQCCVLFHPYEMLYFPWDSVLQYCGPQEWKTAVIPGSSQMAVTEQQPPVHNCFPVHRDYLSRNTQHCFVLLKWLCQEGLHNGSWYICYLAEVVYYILLTGIFTLH